MSILRTNIIEGLGDPDVVQIPTGVSGEYIQELFDDSYNVSVVQTKDLITKGPWVDVRAYGTLGTQAAIIAALADIDTDEKTLYIAPGTWSITSNQIIPSNVNLKVERGAVFTIATGITLTINGGLDAAPFQIFDCTGTGTVAFTGSQEKIYAAWFDGTDIGAKVNAAVASVPATSTIPIVITAADWCGESYATGIVINKPVEVVFPGLRNDAAIYSGTVAGIKITASGAVLSGGVHLDLTGNLNATADGVVFYGASDCHAPDGVVVDYAPRRGISFDAAGVGAYQNIINGLMRVWAAGTGGSMVWFGDSVGAFAANSNAIEHLVLTQIPNSGYGLHFSSGYANHISHMYSNGGLAPTATPIAGDGTAYAIYQELNVGGQNYIGSLTTEGYGHSIDLNGGTLGIGQWRNTTAYDAEVDTTYATLNYVYQSANYNTINATYFVPQNRGTLTPRSASPVIYSTVSGGSDPFNETGNLIIAPRCTSDGRDIVFMTGPYSAGVSESLVAMKITRTGAIRGLRVNNHGTLTGPVGSGTLSNGSTITVIENDLVTANSKIFIMPTSVTAAAAVGSAAGVYISAKSAGASFTLTHNSSVGATATFDYWIIN